MDLEALKAEYISQHKANGTFSDSDLEDDGIQIDVVGGTDSDDELDSDAVSPARMGSAGHHGMQHCGAGLDGDGDSSRAGSYIGGGGSLGSPSSVAPPATLHGATNGSGAGGAGAGAGGGGGGTGAAYMHSETSEAGELEEREAMRDARESASPKSLLFPAKAFHQLNLQNTQHHNATSAAAATATAAAVAAAANLVHQTSPISMRRSNPFSIESLLFNNT